MHCALCVFGANDVYIIFGRFGVANVPHQNANADMLNSLFMKYIYYI